MKRFIVLICLLFACNLIFATDFKQTYEKKNVYKNTFIYMFELYEDNELVMYRIDTEQRNNIYKYIECTVISKDKKNIMRLLSGLIDCNNDDYYTYISNYSGITFISDDYEKRGVDSITERYCYQIK